MTAATILKTAGKGGLFAAKVVVGGLLGGLAYGAYKGGGAAMGFIKGAGGRKAGRLSKKRQHKEALKSMGNNTKKKGKEEDEEDNDAMYSELLKKEAEEAAAAEAQNSAKSGETESPGKSPDGTQGQRGKAGMLVDLVLPISFDDLDDKVKQSCTGVLSKYTGTQDVEVDEIEPQSGESVKAVFWVPAADHEAGKRVWVGGVLRTASCIVFRPRCMQNCPVYCKRPHRP